ncbi:MAG: hypothetical protein QG667_82 [Pseudomonadota bacterium]|nr:hypothetical protein [Pseudomonadota bacterium]
MMGACFVESEKCMKPHLLLMLLLTLGTPLQAAEKAASPQYKPGEKLPAAKARPAQGAYVETTWEALVPKNWNPMEAFKDMKLDRLQDGDPRANEALNKLRDIWDNAPGEPSLNNRKIRIAGFAVPIEENNGVVSEFLLVPYFGACVHSPPPPANQIIHVIAKTPARIKMMETLWVSGTLTLDRSDIDVAMGLGKSGYKLHADLVQLYQPPGY